MNYAQRLTENGLAIFLLHGVCNETTYQVRNYTRKHIERNYFISFLKNLKEKGNPLSMDDVIFYHQSNKKFPPFSFVISFDDGFENNYSIAAPILDDFNIPSIFYVSTDFIENNHMSWTDRIEICIEKCSEGELKLPWNKQKVCFFDSKSKITLLDEIRFNVKNDPTIDIENLINSIYEQCKEIEYKTSDDILDLKMNWKQVKELYDHRLFSVGGHSHEHLMLSFLNKKDLSYQINTSIDLLEEKAKIVSSHYSYPEGLEHCYNDNVINCLKDRNIICCPSAIDGINNIGDDLFHLKRIMVV